MNQRLTYRPRVSRETRLLLITAFLAIAALFVLARVRFPDSPGAPNPVQPILTQLTTRPRFEDLAAEIGQLRPRLEPLLVGSMLRLRSDAAVTLLAGDSHPASDEVLGVDWASGLAVVRAPFLPAPPPVPWAPNALQQARYLVAPDVSTGLLAVRPVYVGSLVPAGTPLWPEPIWMLPAGTDVAPGWFLFTTDALLAGLVVDHEGGMAVVPGAVVLSEADRLAARPPFTPGHIGVDVQALTPPLTKATGAPVGVVVVWVDPSGPAAGSLTVGDVLEAADGQALVTPLHWTARAARTAAGETVTVRVRRGGESGEVVITAAPLPVAGEVPDLGLDLRNVPGTGSVIVQVEAGSAADRAGLREGDIVIMAGGVSAPSPAALRRAFDSAPDGGAVLVSFVRNGTRAVTALEK